MVPFFPIMVSAMLLSLWIILSILGVMGRPICGNSQSWRLSLNITYETCWNGVRSSLLISMLEKLDRITVAIDMKMDGSVLDVKSSLKMVVLSFFSEMDWGTYIVSITKTACKKRGDFIRSMIFLSSKLGFFSTNRPSSFAWNSVFMSGLVFLITIWICSINYRNRYLGLLVLHLLFFMNFKLIVEL